MSYDLPDKPESIERPDGARESVGEPTKTKAAAPTPERLKGNLNEAIGFLRRLPHPFIALTAIHVDAKTRVKALIETRSFPPGAWLAIHKWLEPRLGAANIYFSVNPLRSPKDSKASKSDIASHNISQVDVDCPEGEEQEAFVERMVAKIPSLRHEPSIVIDSGGGLQIFYQWQDPLELNGDAKAIAEAEALTRGIENEISAALGVEADATFNVDRIMRLPGTINIPDIKKISKGRRPRLARVLHMSDLKYPRSAFTPAAAAVPATPSSSGNGLQPAGSVVNLNEYRSSRAASAQPEGEAGYTFVPLGSYENIAIDDERITSLPEKFKRLGQDGVAPGDDRSRAAVSFSKECWKRGIEPNVLAGMLMNWKIGECIRDKGSSTNYHLKRTIERGWLFNHDPRLYSMNEKHHVVMHGAKARVVTWEKNEFGMTVPEYSAASDFRMFHNRERVELHYKDGEGNLKTKIKGLGDWWLDHPKRAQYSGLVYAPHINEPVVQGKLNLWRGFSVSPKEGDCSLYLAHLLDNVCGGNETYFEYLLSWMAYAVQHPDRQGEVAWCMRGREGTGKTIAGSEFGKLFGPHFLLVTNPEHLTGKFNAHLQNCSVLLGDECFFAGNPRHEQILKTHVTGDAIFIEPKGVNSYAVRNYLHIILCTNAEWIVPASSEARRYFVLDVGDGRLQDTEYFSAIAEQMNNGGRSALLHMLLTRDISNFNVRKLPRTEALRRQQALTRGGVDALVEKACSEGQVPCSHARFPGYSVSAPRGYDTGFDAFIDKHADNELRRLGALRVKHRLRREWGCKAGDDGRKRDGKVFLSGIVWPALQELRATFEERHGPQEWLNPEATDWPSEEPSGDDEIPF